MLYTHMYTHIHVHAGYILMQWITTSEDFFNKLCTSHFIVMVRKGLLRVLLWEGVGDWTETAIFWPHSYGHQRCVFLVLLMLNRSLTLLAFSTTSYQQLLWTPTHQSPKGPLRRAFSTTSCLLTHLISNSDFLSWLSYIIVQRSLNRPLNLWNGMFDRHQAEITVMQFTGHSLPVHQSMSVSWDFLPCPISSAKYAYAISFDYWPLGCVTSFWCITLEWHVCPGRRSKYNMQSSNLLKNGAPNETQTHL